MSDMSPPSYFSMSDIPLPSDCIFCPFLIIHSLSVNVVYYPLHIFNTDWPSNGRKPYILTSEKQKTNYLQRG